MENILAMNNLEGKLIPQNVIFLQCFLLGIYFPHKERKTSVGNKKGCINADSELSQHHCRMVYLNIFSTDSKPQNQVNTVVIVVYCVFLKFVFF